MRILIACEESQDECIAFRKAAHEAFSCGVSECFFEFPEWHIRRDVSEILNPSKFVDLFELTHGIRFYTMDGLPHFVEKWDLVIVSR